MEHARDEARVEREAAVKEWETVLASLDETRRSLSDKETSERELSLACESLLADFEVGPGPALVDRLARVRGRSRELAEATTRRVVQRAFAVLVAHYPTVDREVVPQGWPVAYSDEELDAIIADSADFGRRMMDLVVADLALEQS